MGTGGILVAASLWAGAWPQSQLPRLDPPIGVDVNIQSVAWNPSGTALLYTKKETAGTGIGVYGTGFPEGKVLLHVGPEDNIETQWFESAPCVAVIIYKKVLSGQEERNLAEVHLLDAKSLRDRMVLSYMFESKSGIEIDIDPSPALVHAIFRVRDGETKRHRVLTSSLGPLIASPDLDQAVREGFSGPSWSIDGTAVYSKGGGTSRLQGQIDEKTGLVKLQFTLERDPKAPLLGDIPLLSKFFTVGNPPPPAGTPVLEVMPSNGAVRPVRFRGPWESHELELPPIGTQSQTIPLGLGISRGEAMSLWLTAGEENPDRGVLIAPHAGKAWLSPQNRAVAYVVDGALFVRAIGK